MDVAARSQWTAGRPKQPPFDTACIAPWVALEFDPAGLVYACCTSQLYPLGRIGEQRLSDLWNGPRAQVLKDALTEWDMSVACQPCRFHLEHRRLDPAASVYDQYPLDGPDPDRPFMMLFALSNRCNLGCIMCSPALSSRLALEAGLPPRTSPYDDQFFEDLQPLLSGLGVAKFLGGEPFLAPEHHRVWSLLDQLPDPPRLSVTTNGTIWTDAVDWLTDRFVTDISVSVDAATPGTYAAVRRGGDLKVVHRNMERFAQRCRDRGANLHVSFCLMPQNAHELGDFLVWAEQYTFGAPAYVNLVSDEGAALHDLDTDQLRAVRDLWARQDERVRSQLVRNRSSWITQLEQLEDVLAARDRGEGPRSTRAHPAPSDVFAPDPLFAAEALGAGPDEVHRQIERLAAWSDGGEVAVLVADEHATVATVHSGHERLGLVAGSVEGLPLAQVLPVIERADGRKAYLLDLDTQGERTLTTLVLSEKSPARGVEGSVLRSVALRSADGWVLLLAEDRLYDVGRRSAEVRVELSATRRR